MTARAAGVTLKAMFDVAIVGSGPGGATCAAFCARAGLHTLLLERETFPREKVCGDCLNPSCTPVLERLGVSGRIRALPARSDLTMPINEKLVVELYSK